MSLSWCGKYVSAVVAGILLLAGCQGAPSALTQAPPPAAAPTASPSPSVALSGPAASEPNALASPAAAPQGSTNLTVSYSQLLTSPNLAANQLGLFQKNGLNVQTEHIAQGSTGLQALIAGDVQVTEVAGADMLSAAANGADVVIVADILPVYIYKLMVNSTIQTSADLSGKKVGISSIGSVDDVANRAAFKLLGVSYGDVSTVPIGQADARVAALVNGTIDAMDASPIDSVTLEGEGFHVLIDFTTLGLPASTTGLAVERSWLDGHRDVMQRYMDSIVGATAVEKSDPSFDLELVQSTAGLQPGQVTSEAVQTYVGAMALLPYPQPEQYADAISQLSTDEPTVQSLDLSKVLDPEFVQSAADRGIDKS